MFTKLLVLIVLTTATSATLLGLRQRQLEITANSVLLHRKIDRIRKALWDLQTRIAIQLEPRRLRDAIDFVLPDLEPVTAVDHNSDSVGQEHGHRLAHVEAR